MTLLDDDRLAALLASAGAAFEVPASGVDDILARAAGRPGSDDRDTQDEPARDDQGGGDAPGTGGRRGPGRARRAVAQAGRHRVLTAAAFLVGALVVAGAVGTLSGWSTQRTVTSGLSRSPGLAAPRGLTTTTLPASARVPQHAAAPATGSSPAPGFQIHGAQGTSGGAGGTVVTTPTTPTLPSGAVGQSAKIQQSGSLGLTVGRGHLDRTMTELVAVATANDGFVASSQTQSGAGSGGAPYGSITLQVPVDNFDAALSQAQALGKTSSLTTKATDVTGQYVDLQARIAALEASRQQYLTIMTKATTVGDILAVQEQLDAIQSQIEQLQGQLQVLTSETSYSTLTVTVSEGTPPPPPVPQPESGLVRAWHDSVAGFVAGVEGLIRVAGPALFALLCLGALVVGGRVLWRRYQRHRL